MGLESKDWERLLAAETAVEKPLERLGGVVEEGGYRGRGSNANSRDDTLRVAGGALDELTHVTRGYIQRRTGGEILDELSEPDEGEGDRNGCEIFDWWDGYRTVEPGQDVESVRIERAALGFRLHCERLEDVFGDRCDERGNIRLVDVVKGFEFVEIHFVCTLAAEKRVDACLTVLGGREEGRGRISGDFIGAEVGREGREGEEVVGQEQLAQIVVERVDECVDVGSSEVD